MNALQVILDLTQKGFTVNFQSAVHLEGVEMRLSKNGKHFAKVFPKEEVAKLSIDLSTILLTFEQVKAAHFNE